MFGLLDWIKIGGGAALGAAVVALPIYWKGAADGRAAERADALARSMEIIKERSETNDEIGRLDDAALCRELGGEWVQPDNVCR